MNDLVSMVRSYSDRIENGRTTNDIFRFLLLEVGELRDEISGTDPGPDGIAGEAVDVILCALDLIYKNNPEWTDQDILEYARKKCDKWANKYNQRI